MNVKNLTIFIPALKKKVAFQDDLVKKIAGITPIQRAIDKSRKLGVNDKNIHLLTDSEEIRLIGERNGIGVYWDTKLVWDKKYIKNRLYQYLLSKSKLSQFTLILSPYGVLLTTSLIEQAINALLESNQDILKPVKRESRQLFESKNNDVIESIIGAKKQTHLVECKAFILLKSEVITKGWEKQINFLPWEVDHDLLEIESFQDWWVCEKLLQRKRIVFRVIGGKQVGMGHIYRAISLAHEITDHEILFVSDTDSKVAAINLAGYDYWLQIFKPEKIVEGIINLKPHLVINDVLSTNINDVIPLKEHGITVINFEDLGEGARLADLTINELYDMPQISGNNIYWGRNYFFLRDEFQEAIPNKFKKKIESILLTFGGTDQHNLTYKIYSSISSICRNYGIKINIVTGPGYTGFQHLKKTICHDNNVLLTHATGVMSKIMEESQLAITSNGRTVYELAHMNIPAIVIPQNDREKLHDFANEKTGFLVLDIYQSGKSEEVVSGLLNKLLRDNSLRFKLYKNLSTIEFNKNKKSIIEMILNNLKNQDT